MNANPRVSGAEVASARGRKPERADRARNRARIVAAASRTFAEEGVDAQMDDIAARAGVAVGTLYRHFATKEALMVAIVEAKFRQILELTDSAVAREDDEPFEVLAAMLVERVELVAEDAAARAALLAADEATWAGVAETVAAIKTSLQILVDRAQGAGTLRTDIDAADIWTASCGVCAVIGGDESAWRRHLGIVLEGLRPPPGP